MPARFDLGDEQIRRAYLARATRQHPDLAGEEASDGAADLNAAKGVLLSPEARAAALLHRLGGPSAADDKSLPPDFLAEMMDVREQIEAAIASRDSSRLAEWSRWASGRREEHARRVSRGFASDPPALHAIRRELNAWRYVERLIEQLVVPIGGSHGRE